ncbi:hypothetical protein [Meiothermus granaticius]|uniref:Uncharacterized protein n=1 Tax=Meiothermus granaticius NBRC 107808 TaxID=1227551 RepID=A0A399FAN7_9DEIN|nr:hypothetical protein [Meiothermus granaticius]RIH93173.1 hypothetical protein Mgrana_00971 [Meiothermus granaticius NBRC 107808]GEM87727.1 hypothetical protein MGR01S_23520 [Meiothermus granaticius NBRC 107808]
MMGKIIRYIKPEEVPARFKSKAEEAEFWYWNRIDPALEELTAAEALKDVRKTKIYLKPGVKHTNQARRARKAS